MRARQPANELDPPPGQAMAPVDEPGVAHAGPVLVEEVQVDGQRQAVGEQERTAAG